jgi:hypothetical protein
VITKTARKNAKATEDTADVMPAVLNIVEKYAREILNHQNSYLGFMSRNKNGILKLGDLPSNKVPFLFTKNTFFSGKV